MSNKFRFLSHQHIRTAKQYSQVFEPRKRLSSRCFGLFYRANGLDFARIGIITSKKNVRFAVKRNLVRRILREQFRVHQSSIIGYDIVFVGYRAAATAERRELHQCATHLLKKLMGRLREA